MHDEVVTGPKVVDDGEEALASALAELAVHDRHRGWARAWRVAERLELEPADMPTASERAAWASITEVIEPATPPITEVMVFRRLPMKAFVELSGLRSGRVKAYRSAWRRAAADKIVPKAGLLVPGFTFELPEEEQVPFYGENGYYQGFEASGIAEERIEAIRREADAAGLKPTSTVYVAKNLSALKTAVLADAECRKTALAAIKEFEKRQVGADVADRAAAGQIARQREREHDVAETETVRAAVITARAGTGAEASMEVFNAMADVRLGTLRALSLLQQQKVVFAPERAEAIAELCDGAEAAIGFIRALATGVGTALDDAALQTFLDESQDLL